MEASEKAVELGCSPAYLPAALNMKGTFVFLKGDTQGALECLNKAIELDPKYVQCYIKRSSIYIEQRKLGGTQMEMKGKSNYTYHLYACMYVYRGHWFCFQGIRRCHCYQRK